MKYHKENRVLNREKLDVRIKQRSNIFNWRGQFTPELVEYFLDEFSKPDDVILDPFSGSGTVLQEAVKKDLPVYGFEINPAAYAMSKFFTFANIEIEERQRQLDHIAHFLKNISSQYKNVPIYIHNKNIGFSDAYKNFLDFSREILAEFSDNSTKLLVVNILFKAESLKKLAVAEAIQNGFDYIKHALLQLHFTKAKVQAFLCDVRNIHKHIPEKANLVITSPPYINVFNYHQNYRSLMELLHFDILHVAKSEFGSNRKNRGNRFKTVVQYCLDMETALYSILEALQEDGRVIMVVGRESNVRKVPFYNGKLVQQIIDTIPGFKFLDTTERSFCNKFGNNIVEDVLIFKKNGHSEIHSEARIIAEKSLKKALEYAANDVKSDIIEAIDDIHVIPHSPLFQTKDLMKHERITA
jgi:DNA modification methylase